MMAATDPSVAAAAVCHARNGLPDSGCTPGAIDPRITPANIENTICTAGWTKKVRPPTRKTNPIKIEREIAYGIAEPHPKPFSIEELDHLIPLALGGAPTAESNLWPEPSGGSRGYKRKDRLEVALKRMVCANKVGLTAAQRAIASNWVAAYKCYIGPLGGAPRGGTAADAGTSSTCAATTAATPGIHPLASSVTLSATRRGVPFINDAGLDEGDSLALQAPAKGKLPLKPMGAFVGNVIDGPHIGRVYVAGGQDTSIQGVVQLPLKVRGLTSVGDYEGTLNIARDGTPANAIKIKLKVTDAWWWAVGAVLLGALFVFVPKAWLRRWRPERQLHNRHKTLAQEYEDNERSFREHYPEYAVRGQGPNQTGGSEGSTSGDPAGEPFTRPSRDAVGAYAETVDVAIRNYAKSTYYFDTASDAYKKIETSLALVEEDASFFGAADGFGLALRELHEALAGLAVYLRKFPVERQPGIALAAAGVLKGTQLQIGEATTRAATARAFTELIVSWQDMAARVRRYELWLLALDAFADQEPSPMDIADRELLALAQAKANEARNELLDAQDADALTALGTSADLDTVYGLLAYLGGRYEIWVAPEDLPHRPDVPQSLGKGHELLTQEVMAAWEARAAEQAVPSWLAQASPLRFVPAQAVAINKTLRAILDGVVLFLSLGVGVVTALATFYFGKTFGTAVDYMTVIVIGGAAQILVKGVVDVLTQLHTGDAEPVAVTAPTPAEAKS